MEQVVRVKRAHSDGTATVVHVRQSACSGDCHKCSGCGAATEQIQLEAVNAIGAQAGDFVKTVETHQHRKLGCVEEIAYLNGWISKEVLLSVYELYKKNQYGQYLKDVIDGKYQENLY